MSVFATTGFFPDHNVRTDCAEDDAELKFNIHTQFCFCGVDHLKLSSV